MMFSSMFEVLNSFGDAIISWVPSINLLCAAVLFVVCILDRVLAPHVSANMRLVLYLAVLVRVLLPLNVASPIGLIDAQLDDGPMSWWFSEQPGWSDSLGDGLVLGSVSDSPSTATLPGAGVAAALTYGVVATALLLAWGTLRERLRRSLRHTQPFLLEGQRVLIHETIGPAVVGILHPQIVMPHRLLAGYRRGEITLEQIRWVLAHEMSHIARRDPLLLALSQVCVIAVWPVIPMWIALSRVRQLLEEACDARVLRASTDRRSYGETLLNIAQWMNTRRQPMTMNRIGLLGHCSFGLCARLRAIGYGPNRRWPRIVQGVVCILAAGSLIACASQRGAALPEAASESMRVQADATSQILMTFTLIESPHMDDAAGIDSDDLRLLTHDSFITFLSGLTDEGARVLTNPRLLVLDDHEASISIGDREKGEEFFRFDVTPRITRFTPLDDPEVLVDLTFNHSVDADAESSSLRRHQRHESTFSLTVDHIAVFLVGDGSEPTTEPVYFLAVEAKVMPPDAEISSR